jgi:ABC-2 type transport system permease protein
MFRENPTWSLTVSALKMWFRDRQAIFWSLFLPLMLMVIFGIINFGAFGSVDLGIVDEAGNDLSRQFVAELDAIETFDITEGATWSEERQALEDSDRDLVLVIRADFGATADPSTVEVLYNEGRTRESQVAQVIIRQILDELTFAETGTTRRFTMDSQAVTTRNLRYVDFLMPGIVAMAIMQMGLFSVAFAFVQLKSRGILRRLMATPVHPVSFLFSQVFTRLTVSILQTLVLIGTAFILFDVKIAGNLAAILLLALMGGAVFVSMGFAISGWAKTEEVAAPLANVIALPMMFLSGVFFPRDAMPEAIQRVTDFLPLTYLADALRNIAIDGEVLWSQWENLIGLAVWLAISFLVAVRLFKWE